MRTFEFQKLLHKDVDDNTQGAMSPTLATNEFDKIMKINVSSLIRVNNDESNNTYDHLLIKSIKLRMLYWIWMVKS